MVAVVIRNCMNNKSSCPVQETEQQVYNIATMTQLYCLGVCMLRCVCKYACA